MGDAKTGSGLLNVMQAALKACHDLGYSVAAVNVNEEITKFYKKINMDIPIPLYDSLEDIVDTKKD